MNLSHCIINFIDNQLTIDVHLWKFVPRLETILSKFCKNRKNVVYCSIQLEIFRNVGFDPQLLCHPTGIYLPVFIYIQLPVFMSVNYG